MEDLGEDAKVEVTSSLDGDTPVLHVAGEIDLSTAPVLREAVRSAVGDHEGEVVFDLAEVTFMDSSGLSVFLEFASRGTSFRIDHASQTVRRVVETTGVGETLRLAP
jgi:anti-sigma B factor antagonist